MAIVLRLLLLPRRISTLTNRIHTLNMGVRKVQHSSLQRPFRLTNVTASHRRRVMSTRLLSHVVGLIQRDKRSRVAFRRTLRSRQDFHARSGILNRRRLQALIKTVISGSLTPPRSEEH